VEGSFGQNGDRASGVFYQIAGFCCTFLLWAKGLKTKDIHIEMFPFYGRKCLSCKAVHKWVEKFSQGCLKVTDDAQPDRPVETATEATLQWVEEFI
jgi:hypothetical protein